MSNLVFATQNLTVLEYFLYIHIPITLMISLSCSILTPLTFWYRQKVKPVNNLFNLINPNNHYLTTYIIYVGAFISGSIIGIILGFIWPILIPIIFICCMLNADIDIGY